jgi:hypothetical protein
LTATEPLIEPLTAETVVAVVPADEVASEVRSTPSPTVVIAASVGSTPTVSAEEVPLVAGPAEATSVVMPPTPLIIAVPASDSNTPSVNVSTAVVTPGTNAGTKTAALPDPTPTPAPGDKKPAQKRSVEWKATPIERRKTIVVESPPSV